MMPRKLAVSLLLGALALGACGAPMPMSNPDEVGPSGGTVTSSDTASTGTAITVPANAVTTPVDLTFGVDSAPPALPSGWAAAGPYVNIGPASQTFASAATVTIPITDSAATAIFTRAGGAGDWTMVTNATVDTASNTIHADVTALGEFVAAKMELACQAHVPSGNFCSMEGCNFRPLSLPQCDTDTPGSTNYDFYNADFCSNQLTLLVVAAGWCNPCMQEAPMIENLITSSPDYAGKVRVLSVMFQNADFSTPTCSFAMQWRTRFGLTSHMMVDPHGSTAVYYPSMAFPANLLINGDGQIVYRAYGTSAGLSDLQAAIQANLPGS